MPEKNSAVHHKRRNGHHQKRTRHFVKVYAPYLPLLLFVGLSVFISSYWRPISTSQPATLAYATEMSITNLLSSTNTQRTNNGKSPLTINTKLNTAAQAKANDMVARNYWSHNTPDGQAPWVFFTDAGYSYSKAGENLAYGFATSSETVTGWMNSPTHKDNLLDSGFTEVGFGFSNSNNFNENGQQTVVVAMYGKPLASAQTAPSSSTPKSTTQATPQPKAASTPLPVATSKPKVQVLIVDDNNKPVPNVKVMLYSTPREAITDVNGIATFEDVENGEHTAVVELEGERREQKVTVAGDTPVVSATITKPEPGANSTDTSTNDAQPAPTTQDVSRLGIITRGAVPFMNSIAVILGVVGIAYLLSKHSLAVHRYLRRGERYILHHGLFDATVISFVWLCYVVTRTAGTIL